MTDEILAHAEDEYDARQTVERLRRQAFADPEAGPDLAGVDLAALTAAEQALAAARRHRRAAADAGRVIDNAGPNLNLGTESTGLEAVVTLRLSHLPTAICHLLNAATHPLVSCTVKQASREGRQTTIRRIRVTCRIEGYSAPAIDTVELPDRKAHSFDLLPTLFPAELAAVRELTRATVSVLVEDLDSEKVEVHRTCPLWLLARSTAPLSVHDPTTGAEVDLTPYLGAFVTPNVPEVLDLLPVVRTKHPEHRLSGYQGSSDVVEPQVQAVFEALRDSGIGYVNSVIAFDPEDGTANQRIRLPRETLRYQSANCLDGTVLVASVLEAMSLRPAIVLVPGHAFVGWETWPNTDEWRYLETEMIWGARPYEMARQRAEHLARSYQERAQESGDSLFRRWAMRDLRAIHSITPME
ncbi:hypothetical protein ACFPJ1_38850 [Kribbella qitaiheensis]|uniref:hypothetical protein n=1 Tax=Kribbella qitaiheensis TaxID=1544730 RepID=UPI003618AE0D